jgi:hypothetical protein
MLRGIAINNMSSNKTATLGIEPRHRCVDHCAITSHPHRVAVVLAGRERRAGAATQRLVASITLVASFIARWM